MKLTSEYRVMTTIRMAIDHGASCAFKTTDADELMISVTRRGITKHTTIGKYAHEEVVSRVIEKLVVELIGITQQTSEKQKPERPVFAWPIP